jgi:hypothetical protein
VRCVASDAQREAAVATAQLEDTSTGEVAQAPQRGEVCALGIENGRQRELLIQACMP